MFTGIEEIESLVDKLENTTLPAEAWTHHAHLAAGLYHLVHYGHAESIIRLRSRIITLNYFHGTPNSATRGYHETITLFWIWVLDTYIRRNGFEHRIGDYRKFLESPYCRADLLFVFYSKETLFSVKARAEWVDPDLRPLDWEAIV